jgi:hypothetical protein
MMQKSAGRPDKIVSPHTHANYFDSASCNPLAMLSSGNIRGGTTAITTQGGNTVININIGGNSS